jgi:hypothetical protein
MTKQSTLEDPLTSVKTGVYRYWKSIDADPKYHAVFFVVRGVTTLSVLSTRLYGDHCGEFTSDPLAEFLDTIDCETYRGPRFTLARECSVDDLMWRVREARLENGIPDPD